ncbi:hypothetical protein B9T39_00250 [Alloscardovia macacae]|uniref:Beta-carotene 15,15'-monooxygenase n=1 Tax=Alloscardovia macacae TaxID=1160091 RepID=A0A1Y2T2G0_9BIFI|nr:DUF6350 family protein [Alloscardovia macacae]OTA30174.1 hypothetical protein B9T39_00250 [Alloscardovia macacae]
MAEGRTVSSTIDSSSQSASYSDSRERFSSEKRSRTSENSATSENSTASSQSSGMSGRSARSVSSTSSTTSPSTPSQHSATDSGEHAGSHFPQLVPSRAIWRGVLTSVIAFGLFALAIFLFVSLFLLIASMEAGTDLGNVTSSFTGGLIILSQGLAIHTTELKLSIIPLGLTWLSMSLLRATFQRRRNTLLGDFASVLTWTVLTAGTAYFTRDILAAQMWQVAAYPALIAALSWIWSCASDQTSPVYAFLEHRVLKRYASATLRTNLARGLRLARRILITYLLLAFATLLAWIILGWSSMANVFTLTHMGIGSRITTTVLSIGWLPNFLIWALAWLFGATISIGTLGTFSLWVDQSTALPPIPVLGILPQSVASDGTRTALLFTPVLLVTLLGIWTLVARREYKLLKLRPTLRDLLDYLYPLGAFIVSILVTITTSFALIRVSSGSLGEKNLAFLGIDISESLATFGRPIQWGLMTAWLLVIVIVLVQLGVIYGRAYLASRSEDVNSSASSPHHETTDFPHNPTHTTEDTHEH